MNPIFSGFQKMDIEHYSTQPMISKKQKYTIKSTILCCYIVTFKKNKPLQNDIILFFFFLIECRLIYDIEILVRFDTCLCHQNRTLFARWPFVVHFKLDDPNDIQKPT